MLEVIRGDQIWL